MGRDLLSKGLGWALGSGHDVGIWTESWLSTTEPLTPMGPPTFENQAWRVSRLINQASSEWDVNLIRENFPQYEDVIQRLVPSSFLLEEKRVWLPNLTGVYSTKSGYAIAKLCNGTEIDYSFDWKKCVWQVETSPKIKHFLWKANSKTLLLVRSWKAED